MLLSMTRQGRHATKTQCCARAQRGKNDTAEDPDKPFSPRAGPPRRWWERQTLNMRLTLNMETLTWVVKQLSEETTIRL